MIPALAALVALPLAPLPTAASPSIAAAARSAGIAAANSIFTSQSAQCEIPGFPGNAAAFDPDTTGLSYCPVGWGLQIRSQALDAELWRCGLTLKIATTPQDAQQLAGRLRSACERTNAIMDRYARTLQEGTFLDLPGMEAPPSRECRCPASYFDLANSVGTGEDFYGGPLSGSSPAGGPGSDSTGSPAPVPLGVGGTPEEQQLAAGVAALARDLEEGDLSVSDLLLAAAAITVLAWGFIEFLEWIEPTEVEEEYSQHKRRPVVGFSLSWP